MIDFNGISLVKMVKGNTVYFEYYRKNELWYSIKVEDNKFLFPVPISDTGDATFSSSDKATLFLRYIQKQLKAIEAEKELIN